jgi:trigger factor
MPIEIQEVGPCKKRIRVTVPKSRVREEIEKNYQDLSHAISLPGFRRGRVPRQLLEKRFGKSIEHEIEQALIRQTLTEALEENKLLPLGEPKLEKCGFDAEKDPALEFEATVAVRPEFALPDLDNLKVEKRAIVATDEEVQESLEASRRARRELKPKPEGAEVGPEDAIVADIEFLAGGEPKRKEENALIWVKSDRVGPVKVEGLAAKLAGKKAGDAIEFEAALPPSIGVSGAGTAIRLAVKEVKEVFMPAIDEQFAKDAGFDDLKEMKEEIRSRILRAKDEAAERELENEVLDRVLERVSFEVPDDLVEQELDDLALRVKIRAKYEGRTEEEAAAEAGKLRASSREDVVRRLKGIFLLDRIAREQKIFATEDEVAAAVARMAQHYGRSPGEVLQEMESSGALSHLRHELRMEKARKWLRSKAEVVEK